MDHKPLGRTGKTISAMGLGTGTFGREIDEEDSYRIMDYCVERGITFFDTAEAYGGGQARENRRRSYGIDDVRETTGEMSSGERILGSWMRSRGCRDQITLCTKISGGHGKPEEVHQALEASLHRLQTDQVEVYKMHQPDTGTPDRRDAGRHDGRGQGRTHIVVHRRGERRRRTDARGDRYGRSPRI